MRQRRLLLATTALSTMAVMACGKEPLPANPKGSLYDDGGQPPPPPANPKGSMYDAGITQAPPPPSETASATATPPPPPPPPSATTKATSTGPTTPKMPANPKGSHYDAGLKPKPKP